MYVELLMNCVKPEANGALAAVHPIRLSLSVGPWIVSGIGLGAMSVIARAAVVSARENWELTSAEAILLDRTGRASTDSVQVPAGARARVSRR